MKLKMAEPFCGVYFVHCPNGILGCFHCAVWFDMRGIYSIPALHEIYHQYIAKTESATDE